MSWLSDLINRFRRPTPTPPPPPGPTPGGMLEAVNRQRSAAGLAALAENPTLTQVAQGGATDCAKFDRLSHQRSDGRFANDVAWDVGYHGLVGECAAEGQSTPDEAVAWWMGDPPHRKILMDGRYREAGWAYADGRSGRYWFIDLGTV